MSLEGHVQKVNDVLDTYHTALYPIHIITKHAKVSTYKSTQIHGTIVHTLLNTCHHCAGSSTGIKWDSKSFNDLVKHSGGQPFRRHRRCVPSLCSVQGLNKMQNIYSLCTQTVHTNFEIHMKWCHKRTLESIKRCKQTKHRKEFN